jgi:hypothetical protein
MTSVAAGAGDRARLHPARRRAATAKRALAGATIVGFAVALGLARASHPGHHATPSTAPTAGDDSSASSSDQNGDDFGFGFDSGSVGQSSGGAQLGTHVS